MLRLAAQQFQLATLGSAGSTAFALTRLPTSLFSFSTEAEAQQKPTTKLWVGNLNFRATKDEILSYFSPYGATSVYILRDKETNKNRGMAFVNVEPEKAEAAVRENDGKEFMGRAIKVAKSNVPDRPPRSQQRGAPAAPSEASSSSP